MSQFEIWSMVLATRGDKSTLLNRERKYNAYFLNKKNRKDNVNVSPLPLTKNHLLFTITARKRTFPLATFSYASAILSSENVSAITLTLPFATKSSASYRYSCPFCVEPRICQRFTMISEVITSGSPEKPINTTRPSSLRPFNASLTAL